MPVQAAACGMPVLMDDNENKQGHIRGSGPVRVLSLGHVEGLLRERHRLLGAAGFEVTSVDTRSKALKLLDNQDVNVLVIGHRVPVEQRNELAIKAKIWRRAAVIFLYKGNIHKAEFADAVLSVDHCAEHLADTIRRIASDPQATTERVQRELNRSA